MGGAFSDPSIEVSPEQVQAWLEEEPRRVQVVDVRETYEHDAGRIAGTQHIELERVASRAGDLDKSRPVVFHCRAGVRSAMAAQAFRQAGYDAWSMAGGLVRWDEEGRALEPEGGRVADH